ncbi:MAG: 30S ribosomal protein S13 [Armatimonas sp.]
MARIAGVDLPRDKAIEYALPDIFGLGLSGGRKVLEQAGIDPTTKVANLTEAEVSKLREIIERDWRVEGDLRRSIQMNIRRLQEIQCYRGLRHRRGLPVRGQRTSTNARTRKGPRRTVGAKKKAKK